HEVHIDYTNGHLTFGGAVAPADTVTVSYLVDAANAKTVTLRLDRAQEVYTVVNGHDLVTQINDPQTGSAWPAAAVGGAADPLPADTPQPPNTLPVFASF